MIRTIPLLGDTKSLARYGTSDMWYLVHTDGSFNRYLNRFENNFVNSALAARETTE